MAAIRPRITQPLSHDCAIPAPQPCRTHPPLQRSSSTCDRCPAPDLPAFGSAVDRQDDSAQTDAVTLIRVGGRIPSWRSAEPTDVPHEVAYDLGLWR